jgi:hypothetical protein
MTPAGRFRSYAMDILYGDKNDWLNGDEGAIRVLES